jgi:hypothetical protein
MSLVVVSSVRMELGAVSGVYVSLVVEFLVHTESMCFVALLFADCSLDHGLAQMIESPLGHISALKSLLVPALLGQD